MLTVLTIEPTNRKHIHTVIFDGFQRVLVCHQRPPNDLINTSPFCCSSFPLLLKTTYSPLPIKKKQCIHAFTLQYTVIYSIQNYKIPRKLKGGICLKKKSASFHRSPVSSDFSWPPMAPVYIPNCTARLRFSPITVAKRQVP